jgi:hypothetical protein
VREGNVPETTFVEIAVNDVGNLVEIGGGVILGGTTTAVEMV